MRFEVIEHVADGTLMAIERLINNIFDTNCGLIAQLFGLFRDCNENPETIPTDAQRKTSRERPKSAPHLRLKIEKGGPFGLCETPASCKNEIKLKGGPFGDMKKFPQNFFNEIFEQCHSAEKCKRGDTLRLFDIHCVAKYRNK